MRINNIDKTTNFGIKLDTVQVLETASVTVIKSEKLEGIKTVAKALGKKELKFPGHQGYRHLAEIYGAKICEKYPQIAEAANEIRLLKEKNPFMKKEELYEQIKPIINRLGEQVDIEI